MDMNKKEPITMYTFGEAIEKLKAGEITALIRFKWLEAIFDPRIIRMWITDYVVLGGSGVSGNGKCLFHWVTEDGGQRCGGSIKFKSEDILAEDYIDTRQWILCWNRDDFDKTYRGILDSKEQEKEEKLDE